MQTTFGERLVAVRALMSRASVDVFLVPRADQHQGEYVPAAAERLAWLTGFSGSAGIAAVGRSRAAVFVDGRYVLQAPAQVDTTAYEIKQTPASKLSDWLKEVLPKGGIVGLDPWLHTIDQIEGLEKTLAQTSIRLKPTSSNLVDKAWGRDRPPPPSAPVSVHPMRYAGQSAEEKIAAIQATLKADGQDTALLTMSDSVCWAFNIRGRDVAHNPVVLAFALIQRTGKADLFIAPERLDAATKAHLKPLARIREPETLKEQIATLREAGKRIRVDKARSAYWFQRAIGNKQLVPSADPCILPKAQKNKVEIEGTRNAHRRDGAALCRFLAWLDEAIEREPIDELTASDKLEAERAASGELIDLSFDTISGSGPNGAIVHYRSTEATNRLLKKGEFYLLDSGAQYVDGTTDVTRTIAIGTPTAEMRHAFTAVLKGHIAIATARFPKGTRGMDLDPFARRALWQSGLDYDHGTGHGVGSFLSVHEGPAYISRGGSVPLEPGMILSNEPGYYKAGHYGIRIENLLLVRPLEAIPGGERQMMGFEELTLAPIDKRAIDVSELTTEERTWLDAYHARVYRELAPLLSPRDRKWLKEATEKLA